MDDSSVFRQKGPGQVPSGQNQEAIDATPSEHSGGNVRVGTPVWKSFVVNKEFQEQNREGIQAEQNQMRSVAADNRRASSRANRSMFKGANGKLLRVQNGRGEELNPEEWANDPEAGPIARKSLWEREIGTAKEESSASAFLLRDPTFHAKSRTDKRREEISMELHGMATTIGESYEQNPEYNALKRELVDDDDYRKTKAELSQKSYDAETRARVLESSDPEQWWQSRQQPTAEDRRATAVGNTQAMRAETQAADQSAADEDQQLRAELAQGVKGTELVAKQARLAEIADARGRIAQESVKANEPVKAVQAEAEAESRGFFDNTLTAIKRGYAGAAQGANILQGATDATNAQDIVDYEALKKANPSSKEFQDFIEAKGFADSAMAFIKNPVRIISEVIAESAAQMVPSIALGVTGGAIGGALTSAPTGGAAAPATIPIGAVVGGAIGAGSGSLLSEYGSALMDSMQEAGMDASSSESIQSFFGDPEKLATAREFAVKRAVPIAIFDAMSAGLAGKFLKPIQTVVKAGGKVGAGKVLSATGKEIGLQAATGATGEAGGQLVSKGEISDAKAIFLEGIAEVGSGPFEVASNLREFSGTPKANIPATVNTALTAIDPELPSASDDEIAKASLISNPADGPGAIAESVMIERELATVEAEDEQAAADAMGNVEAIRATGDTKATKAAEEQSAKIQPRAASVRAVLKITSGSNPADLTSSELRALGFKRNTSGEIAEMESKELASVGLTETLIYAGPDGAPIVTDEGLKRVEAASPRARGRVKMTEAEAIQKANQRLSTAVPDGAQGDPATGFPPSGGVFPDETKEAVEFDVPMRDGTVLRVAAMDPESALREAADVAPISGQIATPVPNVTNPQGSARVQATTPPPVPLSPLSDGTAGSADTGVVGGKPAGSGPSKTQGETPAAATPGKKARTAAMARIGKARKSPKIAAVLNVTNDPAARAEASPDGTITINPDRIISEAIEAGMDDTQAAEYFDRVLDEEIRHAAQYDSAAMLWKISRSPLDLATWRESHYAGIWKSDFSGEKGDTVRDIYTSKDANNLAKWKAMSDGNKAMEAIRMMSQGKVTEEAVSLWANISESLRSALKAALVSLKKFSEAASPTLTAEIASLEAALAKLQSNDTARKPRAGNPKTDSEKPAQSPPGDGNGESSQKAGDQPSPSNGGAESARGDGAGPSLAIGSKVIFERDGRRLTGSVAHLKNGFARVRPDNDPAISFAVSVDALTVIEADTKPDTKSAEKPANPLTAVNSPDIEADTNSPEASVPPRRRSIDTPARREAYRLLHSQDTELTSINKIIGGGGKLQSPPTGMLKIIKGLAGARNLTEKQMAMQRRWMDYSAFQPKTAFGSTFNGKVAQELHGMLFTQDANSGKLDDWAVLLGGTTTNDEAMLEVMGELDRVARGISKENDPRNPSREMTDAEIAGEQSKPATSTQNANFKEANDFDFGRDEIGVADLNEGDTITIDGEEMTVEAVEDGTVILRDGSRFGRQTLQSGESVYVETDDSVAIEPEQLEVEAKWLVDRSESEGYETVNEHLAADPEGLKSIVAEAKVVRRGDSQSGDSGRSEEDSGTAQSGQSEVGATKKPAPASKMDAKNANSKELFADDGGFALGQDATVDGEKVNAERRAKEEAKAAQDAAQGDIFAQPAKPVLTADEQALKDAFSGMVDGLDAAPIIPSDFYQSKGIPRDKRPVFMDVADQLYDAGVRTPQDLAAKLEKVGGGKLRAYSDAVWSVLRSNYPNLPQASDWAGIYEPITQESQGETEAPQNNAIDSAKAKVMQGVSSDVRKLLLSDENLTVDKIKGLRPLNSTLSRKELDESIEAGITAAARQVAQDGRSPEAIYRRLTGIYINQPSLNAKTSTSKINQAYSTPSPLAYVASLLADIVGGKVITEPTGGHGMLLMETSPDQQVQFNEIDSARRARTLLAIPESGKWDMTGEDGTSWNPKKLSDRLIANPPFGSVMAEDGSNIVWTTAAGKTTAIDHAIMLKALSFMTPDGRAVFIIGGPAKTARSEASRKEHYGRGAKGEFFKYLHDNFGVVDHFTVDGDLYAKQGAGWNVDVITIQGKTPSRIALPSAKAPRMVSTWDGLFQTTQLTDEQRIELNRISEEEVRDSVRGMVDALAGIGNVGGKKTSGVRPESGGSKAGGRGASDNSVSSESSQTEPSGIDSDSSVDGSSDESVESGSAPVEQGSESIGESSGTRGSTERGSDPAGAVRSPVKESGKFQAEYTPFSGEKGLDTLLPRNMVAPVTEAFARIKRDLGGNLTKFVHEKLGYPPGTDITKYLAGEQIDAVAAAIWNFERGGALIIGDQTGIGKGRIAAAIMKYAVNQGFIPVFMTKDPGLHDAMLTEDLPDIASPEIIPAVMDTKLQFESAKKRKLNHGEEYFEEAAKSGKLPGDANAIFVTYSQITADDAKGLTKGDRATARNAGEAPADKWRMRALRILAPKAVFILDESHLASGQSTTGWRVADILGRSPRVYYSSATSVKRPENMGIYFKTNVGKLTNGNMAELTDLMNTGGVPAMQVVSSMLAQDGQYLRRERSFDGVKFITQISEETEQRDRELADGLTGSLRQIVTVQDAMRQAAEAINGVIAATGKRMGVPAANRAKLETVNFSSKLHNIVGQYLLAIKTQSASDTAIREIKAGKKVVVAVQSTMESAIDGLEFGGFEMSYKGLVLRYLDQMRFLTSGNKAFGRGEVETFEIKEKGPAEFEKLSSRELEGRVVSTGTDPMTGDTVVLINEKVAAELMRRSMWDVFERARDAIQETDLGNLPISPIDSMRQAVERAGIRTGEITGRKRGIDTNGEIYVRPSADTTKPARRVAQSAFNNEDLDFLVINQSGSTGISLHASEKAKVQSTRVMIVAQPNLDINEFMQTLGRIHRSGQVVNPEFILLQTALPAEKRPAAILGKKMSMLNANTTSNAKTDVSEGNTAIDIFNQYGDEMAYKVLERDQDLQDQLRPLGSSLDKFFNKDTGSLVPYQEAQQAVGDQPDGYIARTLTGYLAILPVEEQEIFWEKTLADYQAYISYLDQIGQNALEAKALDLQAKTISREVFTEKAEGDSAFSSPSYIETVETKVGKAPLTGEDAVALSVKVKANSRQLLQVYLSTADAAANDLADKKAKRAIKAWDIEKRSEFLSNQRAQRNVIASAISLVGRFGNVRRNDGNAGIGVIEEIKLDEANPLTPSKQVAVIRVNDSRETLRVPVTQLNEAFTPAPNESSKEWDDSVDVGGESAIATGNLMAAMKELSGAGKVITYTTDSGEDRMGILLPKSFLVKRAAVKARVTIDTVEKLISALDSGVAVTNSDSSIKWNKGATLVSLSVPASRARGGDIWRNPMINRIAMGGEFTQVGSDMRATFELSNVPVVFKFLADAGETFSSKKAEDDTSLRAASLPSTQASPFYSQLQRVIDTKMPKSATPAQVIQIGMSGAKAEEVKWSGLVQAVQTLAVDGKVDKAALLEYLADEGSVKFEEVTQQDGPVSNRFEVRPSGSQYAVWDISGNQWASSENDLRETNRELQELQRLVAPTKFSQWVLPGGENYREVVLAMPSRSKDLVDTMTRDEMREWFKDQIGHDPDEDNDRLEPDEIATDEQLRQRIRGYVADAGESNIGTPITEGYRSSHFPDVPNYVAHMRTNERDGGLFIEEIQSDRHQAGRKRGYKSTEEKRIRDIIAGDTGTSNMDMDSYLNADTAEAIQDHPLFKEWLESKIERNTSPNGIADAPFRTTWPLAMFKRALRDAVASGKDWIGWTDGATQAARFSLSKQIDTLRWNAIDGNGEIIKIEIKQKGFSGYKDMGEHAAKDLPNLIGKEMAERIIERVNSGRKYDEYKGLDLEVGGDGMKGFYDNILPKEIGKYVKQWGGKVEQAEIDPDGDTLESWASKVYPGDEITDSIRDAYAASKARRKTQGTPIWRIDITPAMKASVASGQSLYAASLPSTSPSSKTDAAYMKAVESGDVAAQQSMVDDRLSAAGAYWHGTPSGDLRGGMTGLHVGTKQAAMEAMEARIGIPADGKGWDGSRKYGDTLLAGHDRVASGVFGKYRNSGYNSNSPKGDFYARDHKFPTVGENFSVSPDWKPWLRLVLIVGTMAKRHKTDSAANRSMGKLLSKGEAKEGFFYKNEGEDFGSVSAVLPNGSFVKVKLADPITRDDKGNVIPLSQRFNPDSDSILRAASLPEPQTLETLKQRGRADFGKARPLIENAEEQMKAFGSGSMGVDPKFANFGGNNQDSRDQVDIVRAYDIYARETRADRDTFAKAKELLAKDPSGVEELALSAFGEGKPGIADFEQLAIEMFIQKRLAESGDNRQAQIDNFILIQANILNRRETARTLRMGFDKFMTPEERAHMQLADAIYRLNPKIEARAKTLTLAERKAFLAEAGAARMAEVEKELRKMGLRLSQVIGKNRALQMENSRLMKEVLKTRDLMDQKILKAVQKGATLADIKRTLGKDAAAKAQEVATKARVELFEKIKAMAASGMSREQIREAMKDSLKAAPLGGSTANGMSDAEIWGMIEEDFGIAEVIQERPLPTAKPKAVKGEKSPIINPLSTNWSRPEFINGMNSYEFDTKDRAGIMERVEIIRGLAGAMGKIGELQGDKRARAEAKLAEINAILAKYGTDAAGIFTASQGIESYGFDVTDIAHVAAVARAINAIDADVVDKASEYLYASMLSGLQTMLVNATSIVPAVWEMTVGRGVSMSINHLLKSIGMDSNMAEQYGESKYILKALAPAITRAMSNFQASMAAQHPMFDRDVNAMEVDWDKILGGGSHKMIGSISGKKGDIIRLPMRLLTATDDFNRTLLACCEVGTFAYRIAKARGMKPGTPEFDKFIRVEVNTPGSFSYQLASRKASAAIYSNPLPGQNDPHTGEAVPVRDLGDMIGFVAAKITDAVGADHENMLLKAVAAAFKISFFPFQRTPFNIIRKGIRHTLNPFSLFDISLGIVQNGRVKNPDGTSKWEWKIQDGPQADERRLHRAQLIERAGQQLQGAILMSLLVAAAAGEGDDDDMDKPFVITGSLPFLPKNMAERDARTRSGIGAYRISFRRNDGSERFGFSYGRMEPVATLLSATIDTIKSVKRSNRAGGGTYDAAAAAMGGFVSQAQDKTFMRGVGDLIGLVKNIVAEPDIQENRKALQFLAGRVAMVVPNIIKQPIREADSQFRERSEGFVEEMLYQVAPYGQKSAKVNPYGEKLEKPGSSLTRPLDVADTGTDKVNPIDRMLIKWQDSGKWAKADDEKDRKPWFPAPIMNAEFKNPQTGQNVKMNSAQLAEFREQSGKRAMALLKLQKLNMDNPTAMDVEKVKDIISKSRSDMKKMMAFKFARQQPDKT